jgi:hypothetical protein
VAQQDLTNGDETDAETALLDTVFGHCLSQILRNWPSCQWPTISPVVH